MLSKTVEYNCDKHYIGKIEACLKRIFILLFRLSHEGVSLLISVYRGTEYLLKILHP